MTMTKAMTLSWIPPVDPIANYRSDHERMIQLMNMSLDGKAASPRDNVKIDKHTRQRFWRDQEAVDEYIEFMYNLSNKYGGTVVVGEIVDLKGK